jgi:hypothetical protein
MQASACPDEPAECQALSAYREGSLWSRATGACSGDPPATVAHNACGRGTAASISSSLTGNVLPNLY